MKGVKNMRMKMKTRKKSGFSKFGKFLKDVGKVVATTPIIIEERPKKFPYDYDVFRKSSKK